MRFELKLYDFLGFFLPGILIVAVIIIILLSLEVPMNLSDNDLLWTIIVVSVSYFAGNLVQALGSVFERKILVRFWGGFPSEYLLNPTNEYYTESFKDMVFSKYAGKFDFSEGELKAEAKKGKEAFRLALTEYRQKDDKIDTLNASYAFLRGIFVSSIIMFLITSLYLPIYIATVLYCSSELFWVGVLITLILTFLFSSIILYFRYKKRGEDFADAVFRALLSSGSE